MRKLFPRIPILSGLHTVQEALWRFNAELLFDSSAIVTCMHSQSQMTLQAIGSYGPCIVDCHLHQWHNVEVM